jgi:hypothetical protein
MKTMRDGPLFLRGVISVSGVAIILLTTGVSGSAGNVTPDIGRKPVRLAIGETARFPDIDASLLLTGITFHTIPEGAVAVRGPYWTVDTELTVSGVTYLHRSESRMATGLGRYGVGVVATDNKTYAELVIYDQEEVCDRRAAAGHMPYDKCWPSLAKWSGETRYCGRLKEKAARDSCVEDVAGNFNYSRLCEEVEFRVSYCLWEQAVETLDVSLCPRFVNRMFSKIERCYSNIGFLAGGDTGICNVLQGKERVRCVRAIKALPKSPKPAPSKTPRIVAHLEHTARFQGSISLGGMYWKCYRDQCSGHLRKEANPEVICRELAQKAGRISSFKVGDKELGERSLKMCNADLQR